MSNTHPYAEQFIQLLSATQSAYAARDAQAYLAAFADDYYSVQLDASFEENRQQLSEKIHLDIARYDILQMDFAVQRTWFTADTGFAQLAYLTRLRVRGTERILRDQRANMIIGRHLGAGQWEIICKTILQAKTVVEHEQAPEK